MHFKKVLSILSIIILVFFHTPALAKRVLPIADCIVQLKSSNDTLPPASIKIDTGHAPLAEGEVLVEIESSFPGGEDAWRRFLEKNIKSQVPVKKGAPEGRYVVEVKFIVDTVGHLAGFIPMTNFGYGMEDEVIRVLEKSPNWRPAMVNGRKLKHWRIQPIIFNVIDETKKKKKQNSTS